MRFDKKVIGIAASCLLLALQAGDARGQAAAKTSVAAANDNIGVFNVTQSDLLETPVKNDWVGYNGDYTGRRYSALTQITPENVSQLAVKWVFHTQEPGVLEGTPIVEAGVMLMPAGNDLYAIDAVTGKQLWHHARAVSEGLVDDASMHKNKGVAVLGTRIFMETDNDHLLCLDARSGNLLWDVTFVDGNKNYGATGELLIVKDKVIIGDSGGDDGARGFVAAYDTKTGKEAWRFWTIPGPGEFGNDSWPGDMWQHGGGSPWIAGTYDPELNLTYWGTGNPSPDYEGSLRPGDDLYTNCLLALDPDTGQLKWYYQFVPHDLWDYDAALTPVLVDTKFKGQPRKLVVMAQKDGYLYILDRTNGKFLFAKKISEDVNWAKGFDENGRPIPNNLVPDSKGVTVCPTSSGGGNWPSPTYDPDTNLFYFRAMDDCAVFTVHPEPFQEGQLWYAGGERRPHGVTQKAAIVAFNMDTLDYKWRDSLIGGAWSWAGVMSTATGLLAYGDNDGNFVMVDAKTDKPLWHFSMGQQIYSSPMSYAVNGKQYFEIAAGNGEVFVFGLP